jgi:hypothetical protein
MLSAGHQRRDALKPHLKEYWVIPSKANPPSKANSAFAAAMEDTLEVYKRPQRSCPAARVPSTRPSKQLVAETRTAVPMQPGQPARYDYEYQRNVTCPCCSPRSKAGAT